MTIPRGRFLRRHPDTAWRIIEGRAAVVTAADSKLHTLNEVGTRVWELARGDRTVADLTRLMAGEFAAAEDAIARDVDRFVEELVSKGMLETADEPWPPELDEH